MLDGNGERASLDIDPDGQRTDLGRETLRGDDLDIDNAA
jgi:hypothetical protein